ncbi:ATP-grasp domain-containing protein [Corynebacterium sp. sy039]|uniref:ATP-grasp domain-containing protein n=1 Tax=Corynebacterium sp. sy039 TaxID=2599641 RepID=UPI0011B663BC|nr:ATP-grasp domain-containing protein [Corynebacterium sp. sy039]QDZ41819.1 ATP-grasp domain-containing protein [Corynebacterium sp. sy039]
MATLIVDPFSSGAYYPDLLKQAGVEYYVVRTQRSLDSGLSDGTPIPDLLADNVELSDVTQLVQLCHEHAIDRIIIGAESGVPCGEALKIELGLAANLPDKGQRFWNKQCLYNFLSEKNVRVPKQWAIFNAEDLAGDIEGESCAGVLADLPYPVVVKPDVGAGSVGVRIVSDAKAAHAAIQNIVSQAGFFGTTPARAIVQECVSGREYVVDTFSEHGNHHIKAICTYDKHPSSTGSMVYDRLRWLDEHQEETDVLTHFAQSYLEALNHWHGAVHAEMIIDDHGPCLIDLGVRPHGAGHPLKTFALTGDSQLHAEVRAAVGEGTADTELRTGVDAGPETGVASYRLLKQATIEFLSVDRSRTIKTDANPQELLTLPGVISGEINATPGTTYPETHSLLDSEALGLVFIEQERAGRSNSDVLRSAFEAMLEG